VNEQLFNKCAWRLIPFMMLLYLLNYIDRTNVGFAALTMNADLGFSPSVYGFGAGVFFFSISCSRVGAVQWPPRRLRPIRQGPVLLRGQGRCFERGVPA
jgi:hypothetical protein